MQTQLNPQDPPVEPGITIDTYQYKVKNFRTHKMLESTAIMGIALIECDSNNSSSEVSARDSRNFQLAVAQIEREWERAKDYRDAPTGQHELVFAINFPTPMEIQRMKNSKLKSVALELYNFFMVSLGAQASDMQVWVGPQSREDVDQMLNIVKSIVTAELGDGTGSAADGFSVGVQAPNFNFLGQLEPNISGGASPTIQEPSKDASPSKVPDAPDTGGSSGGGSGG